jgi:hypothetical protein
MVPMSSEDWCIAVFKCPPDKIGNVIALYDFAKEIKGVKDLHFLIRDRIDEEVYVSFRLQVDLESKQTVRSKMVYKLGELMSEGNFAVDPSVDSFLSKFSAWEPEKAVAEHGFEKSISFFRYLSELSRIAIKMMKDGYFDSEERVELAHVFSWMLGCAEYGLLSINHFEIGYYDRLKGKNCVYLKEEFSK